jgi:hypothetical protein
LSTEKIITGYFSEHETELYSKHLMACSSVGLTLTERLQKAVGDEAEPNLDENKAKARGILKSVGFDDIVIELSHKIN